MSPRGEEGGGVGETAECIRGGGQLSADSLRDLTVLRVLHAQSSAADSTCGQQPLASLGSVQGAPGCPSELQVEAAHRPSWTHPTPPSCGRSFPDTASRPVSPGSSAS